MISRESQAEAVLVVRQRATGLHRQFFAFCPRHTSSASKRTEETYASCPCHRRKLQKYAISRQSTGFDCMAGCVSDNACSKIFSSLCDKAEANHSLGYWKIAL